MSTATDNVNSSTYVNTRKIEKEGNNFTVVKIIIAKIVEAASVKESSKTQDKGQKRLDFGPMLLLLA
jgi:hypothetical protein